MRGRLVNKGKVVELRGGLRAINPAPFIPGPLCVKG